VLLSRTPSGVSTAAAAPARSSWRRVSTIESLRRREDAPGESVS
jgi:hypothetical protein